MRAQRKKCSIRLLKSEMDMIEQYPGKNFSEKIHALLMVHDTQMKKMKGEDLKENYEIMLQDYLTHYVPTIWNEIDERRRELKTYKDALNDIQALRMVSQKMMANIDEICHLATLFIEQKMNSCVIVRRAERKGK